MGLATPTALWWLALAVPIVAFYILKVRMRRVPVSTVMFWRQVFDEKRPRSLWQRLRHLLSLLMQLLVLSLLVLALCDPFFRWQKQQARRVVLVVDNSASMRATDISPNRLARAKKEAERFIHGLRQTDQMAVVAAGVQPRVVCGLTAHHRTLREALESIPETDGPTCVPEAVALARRLLADHPNGEIVVLSDGCFPEAAKLARDDDIHWHRIGRRTSNVGITRFQARRSLLDPIGYEILAEVTNCSDEPVEVRLELELDGEVVDVVPIRLEPDRTWSQVFEKTSAEGGRLRAALDRPDALPADNEAWAILPRRQRQKVLLVTDGNLFLQKVFEANVLVDLAVVQELPEDVPNDAIVVFHRKTPRRLPQQRVLVIDPMQSTDAWQLSEALHNPVVAWQDKNSPLMAHVRLDNVLMPEARRLKMNEEGGRVKVLAKSATGDPLYCAVERPSGDLLVLTVNLDRGDLPLRTAFPILVSNALAWFAGTKGELRESLPSGSVTRVELPEPGRSGRTGPLVLVAPDGSVSPLASAAESSGIEETSELLIGPLARCGIWQIAQRSSAASDNESDRSELTPLVQIACNLASRIESDLRVPDDGEKPETALAAGWGGRPIWFYLIASVWLLTGLEWYLYQRRWIS
ncbi:MAG: VWA domain-containing protein [Planctomycetes bacterium]|nr:VWA domain-containing protein [Planctomycetota bacterium]